MQSTEEEKVIRTCLISSIGLEPTKAHFHGLIELHGPSWILLGGPKVDIIDFLMITQVFPSTVPIFPQLSYSCLSERTEKVKILFNIWSLLLEMASQLWSKTIIQYWTSYNRMIQCMKLNFTNSSIFSFKNLRERMSINLIGLHKWPSFVVAGNTYKKSYHISRRLAN